MYSHTHHHVALHLELHRSVIKACGSITCSCAFLCSFFSLVTHSNNRSSPALRLQWPDLFVSSPVNKEGERLPVVSTVTCERTFYLLGNTVTSTSHEISRHTGLISPTNHTPHWTTMLTGLVGTCICLISEMADKFLYSLNVLYYCF